jgi:hypothetical protein
MWKNTVQPDKPQTTWGMSIAHWIQKTKNSHCMNAPQFYAKGTLPVLLYFLLAPLFYMDICKHGDNKAYATPSKTDETRIRKSGKLFT